MKEERHVIHPRIVAGTVDADLLQDERLHEQFVRTAAQMPGKVALRCGGQAVTYAALDALTDRWRNALHARGIGPGSKVGVWLTRSIALHAAALAVLKAGATYLPFDENAPADRVATCLADCGAALVLTDAVQVTRAVGLDVDVVDVAALDTAAPPRPTARPDASQPAYVIYTSGSTGRPKGVAVSHASICHLIRAENAVMGVTAADVVYGGFSAAFDMSLEEIFVSYLVGASVVVATSEQVQQVDHLPQLLLQSGVTVLHCVPTLLAMLDGDVPSLRLINLGGEACPAGLADRWYRPGRRLVNSYGPTETTVTATLAELVPGAPVTIGTPLPNYTALIIGDDGQLVAPGESGELCIGGPGVSLGYVNRPGLTAAAFIPVPGGHSLAYPLMYRTGDRAAFDTQGNLVLHGRFDSQVKHRGFRIELGEIEAALALLPGVRAAAVLLRGEGTAEHLAAYVVAAPFDARALRTGLAERLPSYMVPAAFHDLPTLPQLPSGKTNRKALPDLPPPQFEAVGSDDPLLAALQALFPHARVGASDDFFTDLGGHSLLAAALVSRVRKLPRFASMSLQDLYELRTAERLAERFTADPADAAPTEPFLPVSPLRHARCATAQAVLLPFIFALASMEFLLPYLAFDELHDHIGWLAGAAAALVTFIAVPVVIMAVAVAAKWLVLGRVRPGRHPLWGATYLRWWFVGRILELVNLGVMADSPLMPAFYRLMGAKVGAGAHLGLVRTGAHDLVTIGAGASLGAQVLLNTATVEGGWLRFGAVTVGEDAHVGSVSVLDPGSTIGAGGELGNLSLLPSGVILPCREAWSGSPAAYRAPAVPAVPVQPPSPGRSAAAIAGFAAIAVLLVPLLNLLPVLPALGALELVQEAGPARRGLLLIAPVIALGYTLTVLFEVVLLRWLVLGRVQEGEHSTTSLFFLRKWTVDRLMELSLTVLHPIYASLYVVPFFRALGAKIGAGAEVSTAAAVTHDLLEIGDGAFVADAVTLGDPEIRRGRLTLRRTTVGKRTFIGNSAFVPDGSHLPDDALVGCLSVPPEGVQLAPGQACLGSPAILLPSRQQSTTYDARLTFRPGAWQVVQRLAIEGARILLPRAAVFAAICVALDTFEPLPEQIGVIPALLAVPLLYVVLFCVPALLGVVAIKWALVGRYRTTEHPMWSRPVWLSEAVTAIYEGLPVPLVLRHLHGTPFLPMALRLFGTRIGRRVWMDTTDITEFDLVTIGDDAALNQHSGPQTHLFEDRVMKIDGLVLGARSSMGPHSIALPGAALQDDARLGSLSLVMKGETIPAGPPWAGSPARRHT